MDLKIGRYYNFSLYTNSVLGSTFHSLKLIGILDYNNALKFGNVVLLHKEISPYLPIFSNLDYTKYTYYLFEGKDKKYIIADAWIIPDSVEEVDVVTYTLKLSNVNNTQLEVIKNQLRILGITFEIVWR